MAEETTKKKATKKAAKKKTTKKKAAAKKAASSTVFIEQYRSAVGRPRNQRKVLDTLGLRRIRHVVERQDSPAVRGAVTKISHLVRIVENKP